MGKLYSKMETDKSKSIMKRACENDGDQNSKCQRIESSDEPVEKTTKIIDLNDDCLMKIFGHLDLQSLFNVAIANEWLRPAAGDVYKRKYGSMGIVIYECDDYHPKTPAYVRAQQMTHEYRPFKIWYNFVHIYGLKTTLAYLRCFGASITELKIAYNHSESKRYGYVHQYINDYCAERLVRLTFWDMANTTIEQFQKNFVNVEEILINFSNGDLTEQWSSFFKCFPNLLRLHIYRKGTLMNVLLDAIKDNQPISELTASTGWDRNVILVDSTMVEHLVNEHLALQELRLFGYHLMVKDVIMLIRQLHSLERLYFWMLRSEYSQLLSQLKENGEWAQSNRTSFAYPSLAGVELKRQTQRQ